MKERQFDLQERFIDFAVLLEVSEGLVSLLKENDEFISILFKSIETAQKNEK